MLSGRTATAALALGFVLASVGAARAEQDRATPQEVIQRVQQAAQDLAKSGEAGLATFSSKNATSVWKDSYTFVVSCEGGTAVAVASPVRPDPMGTPMAQILTFGPKSGAQIAADFCTAGGQPDGGWVEYNFPEPGETQATRKVSYLLAAEGTPYAAGAGLHDETAKLEDLESARGRPAVAAARQRGLESSEGAVRPSEVAGGEADEVAFDRAAMFPFGAAPARLHDDPVALAQAPQIAASRSLGAISTKGRIELCAVLQRLSRSAACLALWLSGPALWPRTGRTSTSPAPGRVRRYATT